jgi:D-sedoheptulose 7-phosphate isomerase
MLDDIRQALLDSMGVKQKLLVSAPLIQEIADRLIGVLQNGQKIMVCGNGGSAADAQHMVAELVGRFTTVGRRAFPAIALTTNSSILTAWSNDYSYETVFARQVEALAEAGDALIGISTSGNSPNILHAIEAAKPRNVHTIGLAGEGGRLANMADLCLCVPSRSIPRIQEAHITIIHILCALIEEKLGPV